MLLAIKNVVWFYIVHITTLSIIVAELCIFVIVCVVIYLLVEFEIVQI